MNDTDKMLKLAGLEALLFVHGSPMKLGKVAEVLELDGDVLQSLLIELEKELKSAERGLGIVAEGEVIELCATENWKDKKIQLATKPEFSSIVEQFVKSELKDELTPASLEALSIIAYLGPISRTRIEYVRGVNSSFILRNLLLRGLIEKMPDPDDSRAVLYAPTIDFLRHLGASKKEELPDFEKLSSAPFFASSDVNDESNDKDENPSSSEIY